MKTIKASLLTCLVLFAAACNDNDDPAAAMSSEEAAELIAASLAESSSGLTVVVNTAVVTTETAVDENSGGRVAACGYSDTESFTATNPPASAVTYNYSYSYSFVLTCGNDVPQSLAVDVSYTGTVDAPRLASDHAGTVDLDITELDETANSYLIDGSYTSSGSFQSKIRNKTETTSSIDITLNDLAVDKTGKTIMSGSASATIMGSATGKGSFTFTGSIVFNGDGTATVTINSTVYLVDLTTGAVEPA